MNFHILTDITRYRYRRTKKNKDKKWDCGTSYCSRLPGPYGGDQLIIMVTRRFHYIGRGTVFKRELDKVEHGECENMLFIEQNIGQNIAQS